ncbi:MAG: DUF29 domain-containing protein [Chroococcidiopsidaceae cyanobacterium CP_BM_RX_35]|nr:DUF29 domain-containing protein [Chroococcidiopsidaceae cyanobacterium CP_BM_RX_35]
MLNNLYDTDFVLWSEKTAQLLRERAFEDVDWANVIEEIACYRSAVAQACEETNLAPDIFPETCPFTLEQILSNR